MKHETYMKIALNEAKKAYKNGDVPIGAIIVKNNKIIAKAYNKKEKDNNAIQHAEILAISKACKKLKTWHLEECTLYSTMEPCMMCSGAIIQSRIKNIIYSLNNEKFGNILNNNIFLNKKYNIISNILYNESKTILQSFFQEKRNNNVSRETL